MNQPLCSRCRSAVDAGDRFCKHCGADQATPRTPGLGGLPRAGDGSGGSTAARRSRVAAAPSWIIAALLCVVLLLWWNAKNENPPVPAPTQTAPAYPRSNAVPPSSPSALPPTPSQATDPRLADRPVANRPNTYVAQPGVSSTEKAPMPKPSDIEAQLTYLFQKGNDSLLVRGRITNTGAGAAPSVRIRVICSGFLICRNFNAETMKSESTYFGGKFEGIIGPLRNLRPGESRSVEEVVGPIRPGDLPSNDAAWNNEPTSVVFQAEVQQ